MSFTTNFFRPFHGPKKSNHELVGLRKHYKDHKFQNISASKALSSGPFIISIYIYGLTALINLSWSVALALKSQET